MEFQKHFSPLISIKSDESVNSLLNTTNNLSNLTKLLKPFDVLHNVPLRTVELETHHAPNFFLRFNELDEIEVENGLNLNEVIINSINDINIDEDDRYQKFVIDILSHHNLIPYNTFQHPCAFILATTTDVDDPIQTLSNLAKDVSMPDVYAKRVYMNPTPNYVLRYYVLVHDIRNGTLEYANDLLEKAKRAHGIHCALLIINSNNDYDKVDDVVRAMYNDTKDDNGKSYGKSLNNIDVTVIRSFVRELVVQSLIPWMEKCVRDWNQVFITNRKGITNKLISSFGVSKKYFSTGANSNKSLNFGQSSQISSFIPNERVYTSSSLEATFRRLGDFSFMLRDFKLSTQVFNQLRRDTSEETEGFEYLASANEMLGLSHLLSPNSFNVNLDNVITYFNDCIDIWKSHQNYLGEIIKASICFIEGLKFRGINEKNIILSIYVKLSTDVPFFKIKGLLLEKASLEFLKLGNRYRRKGLLYLIQSGLYYFQAQERELAFNCLNICNKEIDEKFLKYSFIQFHLGLLSTDMKQKLEYFNNGLRYFKSDDDVNRDVLYDVWKSTLENLKEEVEINKVVEFPLNLFRNDLTYIHNPRNNINDSLNEDDRTIFENMKDSLNLKLENLKNNEGNNKFDVDDKVTFNLFAHNPFNYDIKLFGLKLVINDEEYEVDDCDHVLLSSQINRLQVKITVKQTGIYKLTKIRYSFENLLNVEQSLKRNGERLNDNKVQRMGRYYNEDKTLEFEIKEKVEKFNLNFIDFPKKLGLGQGILTNLQFSNEGKVNIEDVKIKVNEDSFIVVSDNDDNENIYERNLDKNEEDKIANNNLYNDKLNNLNISLGYQSNYNKCLFVRGDDLGLKSIHLLILYKVEGKSQYNYKEFKLIIEVRPMVEVKLIAHPDVNTLNAYKLFLNIENLLPDHQIKIEQVSLLSRNWRIKGSIHENIVNVDESIQIEIDCDCLQYKGGQDEEFIESLKSSLHGHDVKYDDRKMNLKASHIKSNNDGQYISLFNENLLNIILNARRNLKEKSLIVEFNKISYDTRLLIFNLMDELENDLIVTFSDNVNNITGHCLVSGIVMGCRHSIKNKLDIKSITNSKSLLNYNKKLILNDILQSKYNKNDSPIKFRKYIDENKQSYIEIMNISNLFSFKFELIINFEYVHYLSQNYRILY